jgi:hypothetical protein
VIRIIDINDTAVGRGWCILAEIVIRSRKSDYFFEDVALSIERRKNYILIYKRKP